MMKLLIDIGNTNTSIAVVRGKKIRKRHFIHTDRKQIEPESLRRLLSPDLRSINEVVMVSVVPEFQSMMKRALRAILPEASLQVVGKEIRVPIRIRYRRPEEVGQDRLTVSFAASRMCGCPVLVVDFGTAVTFDFVNAEGEYEGGLIFPGLRLGLESLVRNTALLPKIEVRPMEGLIGRDTRSSMNKGILLGYAAMCDGLVQLFRKKYGRNIKVVATGGDAGLVAKYTCHIKEVYPDLIFTGLRLLAE